MSVKLSFPGTGITNADKIIFSSSYTDYKNNSVKKIKDKLAIENQIFKHSAKTKTRKVPFPRFNSDPRIQFAAKNSPLDMNTFKRSVTFFGQSIFDNPLTTWKDFGALSDPRLSLGGYKRTSFRDPRPITSGNVLYGSHIAAMTGGASA